MKERNYSLPTYTNLNMFQEEIKLNRVSALLINKSLVEGDKWQ